MNRFKYFQASFNLKTFLAFIKLFPDVKLNILISFAMLSYEVSEFLGTYREKIGQIILDSGTWSLNNAKNPDTKWVNLDNYKRYLLRFGHLFNYYFNFDSDFFKKGAERNQYNQMILEDAGLTPKPVAHDIYGTEIGSYIDAGYKRIAIGSPQIHTQDDMVHVTSLFYGTGIKLHILGKSKWKLFAPFNIDASDSAMWAREGGYGYIRWWNPNREGDDKTDRIYLEEFIHTKDNNGIEYSAYEYKDEFDAYLLDTFGLKYKDLVGEENAYKKMLVNTYYFVKIEEEINKIHQKLGYR